MRCWLLLLVGFDFVFVFVFVLLGLGLVCAIAADFKDFGMIWMPIFCSNFQ